MEQVSDKMLWMGDLEPYMTAEFISSAFRKMGETVYCVKIVYDKYSGLQSGYCFLEMADGDACRRCMLNVIGKVGARACGRATCVPAGDTKESTAGRVQFVVCEQSEQSVHRIQCAREQSCR
jgi:hypothetical protein